MHFGRKSGRIVDARRELRRGDMVLAVTPAITLYLSHKNPDVREAAISALAQLGVHAKDGVEAITKYLENKDKDVRGATLSALGKLGEHFFDTTEYIECPECLTHFLTQHTV